MLEILRQNQKWRREFLRAFSVLLPIVFVFGTFIFYASFVYSGEGGSENYENCSNSTDDDSDSYVDWNDLECLRAPGVPNMEAASDTGSLSTDNITSDNTPDFTISCDSNHTVTLIDGGVEGVSGACSLDIITLISEPLSEGVHSFTSTQTGVVGEVTAQTSSPSAALSVTIDTGAPALSSASVNTITLTLTYGESLNTGSIPAANSFAIDVDGSPMTVNSVDVTGATVVLTLDTSVGDGTTVTLDYTAGAAPIQDIAGNGAPNFSGESVTNNTDTTAPTVSTVTSPTVAGSYNVSDTISIRVTFTEAVTVTGTPQLTLETGDTDAVVNYASGSGTTILTFIYTVASGETSSDLDYNGTTALALNSGTIKDAALNAATLTLATPGAAGSLAANEALVIDTTAPAFSSVTPVTSGTVDDVTTASDITFTLSEALTSGSTTATRTSGTSDGNSPHICTFAGTALNSGAHTLDLSDTTNSCTSDVSNLVSGTVYDIVFRGRDAAGNFATAVTSSSVTFDNTAPTITSVSSGTAAGSYNTDDVIDIDVTFSEAVTSTGNVTVTLETGTTDRTCTFTMSGGTTGTCDYTVSNTTSDDTSSDLDATISGTIADTAGNAMSNFTPTTGLAANEALVIDTTEPTISSVSASAPDTTSTTITWTTDESSNSKVSYGTATGVYTTNATDASSVTSHSIALSSLTSGTAYFYVAVSADSVGNYSTSTEQTVTTASPVATTVVRETSSGGRIQIIPYNNVPDNPPTPIETIKETAEAIIDYIIPDFLQPKEEAPPEPPLVPAMPQVALQGEWDLISNSVLENFVFGPLPSEITNLTLKFPKLGEVFDSLGIVGIADLNKLQDVSINLPKIEDKANPPTEVVFAKTSEGGIAVSSSLNVGGDGVVEQRIHTLGGKALTLEIKPEGKAESVKGLLTFKRKAEAAIINIPTDSLLASAMLAVGALGEKAQASVVGPELLIFAFEYTDPDGDGIYTADIKTPQTEGEYEVITIIEYKDEKQGSKELRMVTVIDPEGYVYEKDSLDREIRIKDAVVSIFEMTPSGEVLWDAKKYSQDNPQTTGKTGKYAFLVPEGSYFISVESSGHDLYRSKPFDVREGNPVHQNIELVKKNGWLYNLLDWKIGVIFLILAIYVTHIIDRRRRLTSPAKNF